MIRDILGLAVFVLTVCSLLPSVVKVYCTQRTQDLSLGRYSMIFMGNFLWSLYFWESNWLAFVNEILCTGLYSYLLYMKLREKEREPAGKYASIQKRSASDSMKVQDFREFLEKFTEDDQVRFLTDQGYTDLPPVQFVWDDIFYKEIAVIP